VAQPTGSTGQSAWKLNAFQTPSTMLPGMTTGHQAGSILVRPTGMSWCIALAPVNKIARRARRAIRETTGLGSSQLKILGHESSRHGGCLFCPQLLKRFDDFINAVVEQIANEKIGNVASEMGKPFHEFPKIEAIVKLANQPPHAVHTPNVLVLPGS
jgi:hypothetical protein